MIDNPVDMDRPEDEQLANARLIAAAPDLLAACKRLVLAQSEDVGAVIQAMGMVRAAIAKAEGGAP